MDIRQLDAHWYTFWTQIIALALAILLVILWFAGLGPGAAPCCQTAQTAAPLASASSPAASAPAAVSAAVSVPAADTAFHFRANAAQGLQVAGETAAIGWWDQRGKLDDLLKRGQDVEISGDARQITLRGAVPSAAAKDQLGAALQALVGAQVVVDNQLSVVAPPSPSEPASAAADSLPPTVQVHFAVGQSILPVGTTADLAAIVTYLKAHPDSKAILSGYHDASGNAAINAALSKRRAQAVQAALLKGGVSANQTTLRKPQDTTGSGDAAQARRVDVSVK